MITFRKLSNTIVGTISGKPFNISRTKASEEFLTEARDSDAPDQYVWEYIKNNRSLEVAGSNKYLLFNAVTDEYFLMLDNRRSKHAIPSRLVKYIEESFDKDVDFMPVIKSWAKLLTNPRYTKEMGNYFSTYIDSMYVDKDEVKRLVEDEDIVESVATSMCTYQDLAFTQEGDLVTYKVADKVTWEYVMVEQEDGSFVKERNDKYKRIPAVLDAVTGDVLEEEKFEKPDFLEDYLYTPAICKSGDKFFSGDKIGYVYQVGQLQYLPEDATRNLKNTFGGGGLSMCSFN